MNILHIIPSLIKGGAERITLDICNEIQRKKEHKIKLITFRRDNEYVFLTKELDYEVITSYLIPSILGKNKSKVIDLQNSIDKFKPDIIHIHLFEAIMVLSAIKIENVKWFIHFHSNMFQLENFSFKTLLEKHLITNFYEKSLFIKKYKKRDVQLITISEDTKKYANRVLPDKFKINFLWNAINIERFKNLNRSKESNRVVMIGSLTPKKGQELAIKVVNVLKNRNKYVLLDLLGDGPCGESLKKLATDMNVQDQIFFHGNVNHPENYLHNAFCYIHTSKSEPFGLALIEAMASGLPVISTDGKGNRDLIEEGKNGFMIWERNPEKIADKVELLINDNKLCTNLGFYAKKFSTQFNIDRYCQQLLKLYQQA